MGPSFVNYLPKPYILNLKPYTSKPYILNLKPYTPKP